MQRNGLISRRGFMASCTAATLATPLSGRGSSSLMDRPPTIPGPVAMNCSKQLAQKEGIFVGISAGASFAAALEVANGAAKGTTILAMLPDTGERYLSTEWFS